MPKKKRPGVRDAFDLGSRPNLHSLVVRTASAFRRYPIDYLIRIGDVAGLTVHAIRKIDFQLLATVSFLHLVHRCGTKPLTRIAVLFRAASRTDLRIENV